MAQTELDLHSESKAYMEATKSLWSRFKSVESMTMEKLRSTLEEMANVGGPGVAKDYQGTREELFVDSKEVEGGIPIYVYKPKSVNSESDGVPIVVYFHGGGGIMGSRNIVNNACRILSNQAGCTVVNVEYRLAPEHKFPAMMNDAYATVRWVLGNRSLVGGTSKSKVGVAGDSAGGQIAASVSHHVPGVDFQILAYPWLSPAESNLPSHDLFKNGPHITESFLDWLRTLVVQKKEDLRDPRFHILGHKKYDHLPPTLFIVAEFDAIRDESYEYCKRLTAAGVDNELHLAKGAIHGFFTCPGPFAELCDEAYVKAVEFINRVGNQH